MKKRLAILSLTFCILFQTFGIQIVDYNAVSAGNTKIKKQNQSNSPNPLKSYFLALEENEKSAEDDTDSDNFYPQQVFNHFSAAYLLLSSAFYSKNSRHFLFFNCTLKVHKFLFFRNLRI